MSSRPDDVALKDINQTIEYAHLHRIAINMLPIGLFVCLFGFYFLSPLDGSEPDSRAHAWLAVGLGWFLAVMSLLALRKLNKPALSLSVDGIVCWPISEQPIPWHEIRGVETERYWSRSSIVTRTVTVVLVSKEFYERINGSYFGLTDWVVKGDPVKIRIPYFDYGAPFAELHDAIVARWRVFGPQDRLRDVPSGATVPRVRAAAIRDTARRALAAVTPSTPGISPLRFWLSFAPVLGIFVLLANLLGLWSTQAQREARYARYIEAQKWAEALRLGDEAVRRSEQIRKEMAQSFQRFDVEVRESAERARQQQRAAEQPQPVPEGGHREAVLALAVMADGRRFVSAGGDRAVKLWEMNRPAAPRNLGAHKAVVRSVLVIDDGTHVLSASDDGDIVLRAISDGRVLHTLRERGRGDVAALSVSADGRRAVSVYDKGGGDVWSLSSRIRLQELDSGGMRLQAVAVSSDGRRALGGGADGLLRLWDLDSGHLVRSFGGHQGPVYGVAFLPDGKRAVSGGGDSTLRMWDVESGNEVRSFAGHTDTVYSVAVSIDGKRILAGSLDRTARLWDSETAAEVARFAGHEGPVYAVAFAKEGTILTGSGDRNIRLWNATGGDPLRVFAGGERLDR